ncbi:ZIP family metal transporter [Ammoniphilus sp. CFH 90114]|uniref:ZIP family metal transporter n=1 Tax=Ammoniphilus sp. CFH 90114 TaxID=2493665 RepID=UPI00100DFE50|nr:ZIP family metal transporter [Ammoniphilus sp. CFH 90114]RXT08687.1 zinc/iron permease [Ammoniphilus sp. CFH 90114]
MELLILSSLTGLTTLFGAALALLFGQPSKKILAFYLGLSSGIMVLIVLIDLLPTAFMQGPYQAVGIGLGLGLAMMLGIYGFLENLVRHGVSLKPKKPESYRVGMLIAIAIGLHNIPEGIAIGAGFETHNHLGVLLALSIAIHNIPEGIGMAIPLAMAGVKKRWVLLLSFILSLCIPLGAWLGQKFFVGSPFLVAAGTAFAAGAMGFIVWKEIGPASLRYNRLFALWGMAASVVLVYIIHALR